MSQSKAKALLDRADQAFNTIERKHSETEWKVISENVLPNQSGGYELGSTPGAANVNPGSRRTRKIMDSSPVQNNQDLASAMHSTLSNPATQWSKLQYSNETLNNHDEAVSWLQNANKVIHKYLSESNHDVEIAKNFPQYTALGNQVLLEEPVQDEKGNLLGLRFKAIHLAEVAWEENLQGDVSTIYRRFQLTAAQAYEKWQEGAGKKIVEAATKEPNLKFSFVHVITPRHPSQVKSIGGKSRPTEMPISSTFISRCDNVILEEGGYYEMPVFVTRWNTAPGEVIGRGPGSVAIGTILTLNKLQQDVMHSLARAARPTWAVQRSDIIQGLALVPDGVNIMHNINGIKQIETNARFDVTQMSAVDMRELISKIFFIDKVMLPPRTEIGEMTATETLQRAEEMQRIFGPTVSRVIKEQNSPLITRTFRILLRAGVLGEVPEIVKQEGLEVDIGFVNQLARAQQLEEVTNVLGFAQDVGALAQLNPEALDYFDVDEAVKTIGKVRGVVESVVTSDEAVQNLRKQRSEQQERQQALESGVQLADISSKSQ